MKSKFAKAAVTGGVALAALGVGAGVASAEPHQGPPPPQQPQFPQPQPQWNNDHRDDHRNDWDRDHHPQFGAEPHGFWFFGQWVPLPW